MRPEDGLFTSTRLTKLRCTPKPRCFPLHSKHMKMPYDTEAHCGFRVLQSTQVCIQQSRSQFCTPGTEHRLLLCFRNQRSDGPCSPLGSAECAKLSRTLRTPYYLGSRKDGKSTVATPVAHTCAEQSDVLGFVVTMCRAHRPTKSLCG